MIGKSVSGVVQVKKDAEQVIERLKSAGISRNNISILVPGATANGEAPAGPWTWLGPAEMRLGGGKVAIIAAGPILTCLKKVRSELPTSLTRAMTMLGIPEPDAKNYQGALDRGGTWFSVLAFDSDGVDRARWILADASADLIATSRESRILEPARTTAEPDPASLRKRRKRFRLFSR